MVRTFFENMYVPCFKPAEIYKTGAEDSRNNVSRKDYQAKGDGKNNKGREGVKKSEKWADVIYGGPLHLIESKKKVHSTVLNCVPSIK